MAVNFDIFFRGNSTSFEAAAKKVLSIGDQVGKKLDTSIGQRLGQVFSAGTILAYGKNVANFAENIINLSDELGISTKTLQEWGYAAEHNGAKLETVKRFFEGLATAKRKAMEGDSSALENFFTFGISEAALSKKNSELGLMIANKFRTGNQAELMPALREIGGRGSQDLIPMFKSGIAELADEANRVGAVLDDEILGRLKSLNDELQNIASTFRGPVAGVMDFLLSQLKNVWDFVKMAFSSPFAFAGTLAGGGSLSDALKASNDVIDQVVDDRKRREDALAEQARIRKEAEKESAFARTLRTIDMTPRKSGGDSAPMSVSGWQKLGAAIRFAHENRQIQLLQRIERNTATTAEKINVTRKDVLNGNFGGAFGP